MPELTIIRLLDPRSEDVQAGKNKYDYDREMKSRSLKQLAVCWFV